MKETETSSTNLPPIAGATADFERRTAEQLTIVRVDLVLKPKMMAESVFPLCVALFIGGRSCGRCFCPCKSPTVNTCGARESCVDNFGTWRDLESRLIWGVNDFNEAWPAA
jgi:hypothetical protein